MQIPVTTAQLPDLQADGFLESLGGSDKARSGHLPVCVSFIAYVRAATTQRWHKCNKVRAGKPLPVGTMTEKQWTTEADRLVVKGGGLARRPQPNSGYVTAAAATHVPQYMVSINEASDLVLPYPSLLRASKPYVIVEHDDDNSDNVVFDLTVEIPARGDTDDVNGGPVAFDVFWGSVDSMLRSKRRDTMPTDCEHKQTFNTPHLTAAWTTVVLRCRVPENVVAAIESGDPQHFFARVRMTYGGQPGSTSWHRGFQLYSRAPFRFDLGGLPDDTEATAAKKAKMTASSTAESAVGAEVVAADTSVAAKVAAKTAMAEAAAANQTARDAVTAAEAATMAAKVDPTAATVVAAHAAASTAEAKVVAAETAQLAAEAAQLAAEAVAAKLAAEGEAQLEVALALAQTAAASETATATAAAETAIAAAEVAAVMTAAESKQAEPLPLWFDKPQARGIGGLKHAVDN